MCCEMELLFFILLLLALLLFRSSGSINWRHVNHTWKTPYHSSSQPSSDAAPSAADSVDSLCYEKAYQKKWLLTMNEKAFYRQLSSFAAKKNMTVFTKVRLLDLLEPVKNQPKYKTYFYKVQAKHVDFVLCDEKLVARYIVELDDNSHTAPDRAERDLFVDTVLQAVGYKVLRLKAFDECKIEQVFFKSAT